MRIDAALLTACIAHRRATASQATAASTSAAAASATTYPVPDVAEYEKLVAGWESLKWRIIPRPGGATMKPDDYYSIYGAVQ